MPRVIVANPQDQHHFEKFFRTGNGVFGSGGPIADKSRQAHAYIRSKKAEADEVGYEVLCYVFGAGLFFLQVLAELVFPKHKEIHTMHNMSAYLTSLMLLLPLWNTASHIYSYIKRYGVSEATNKAKVLLSIAYCAFFGYSIYVLLTQGNLRMLDHSVMMFTGFMMGEIIPGMFYIPGPQYNMFAIAVLILVGVMNFRAQLTASKTLLKLFHIVVGGLAMLYKFYNKDSTHMHPVKTDVWPMIAISGLVLFFSITATIGPFLSRSVKDASPAKAIADKLA